MPANQNAIVSVQVDGDISLDSTVLLEGDQGLEATTGVKVVDTLPGNAEDGSAQLLLTNVSGLSQKLEGGTYLGRGAEVEVVTPEDGSSTASSTLPAASPIGTTLAPRDTINLTASDPEYSETVHLSSGHVFHITDDEGTYLGRLEGDVTEEVDTLCTISCSTILYPEGEMVPLSSGQVFHITEELRSECRKKKLLNIIQEPDLPPDERQKLMEFLVNNHEAFSLEGERGETDLLEMVIDPGDAHPLKQAPRRMPYSVRQEVARQLREMQQGGVIEASNSAWASPVVLVRKRDGSHRFCVDYRGLNALTKPDTFPLPRIDELLDRYFSTIDLASGYWQIRVDKDSQEKTAFVTPQGLFHFKVMPFGLTNVPAVFQHLMQRVVMCLNPEDGPDYVSVYLDDVLVFSDHWPIILSIWRRSFAE